MTQEYYMSSEKHVWGGSIILHFLYFLGGDFDSVMNFEHHQLHGSIFVPSVFSRNVVELLLRFHRKFSWMPVSEEHGGNIIWAAEVMSLRRIFFGGYV